MTVTVFGLSSSGWDAASGSAIESATRTVAKERIPPWGS
jgi:hypothetical protein